MRFWWVNQNQTFKQEIQGGYLWSPQFKSNGHRNPFYETMREVSPGDLVFSFCDTRIQAIGKVGSYCHECLKPDEFGQSGVNWDQIGWRVVVRWQKLIHQVRVKNHIDLLKPFLPSKYSPISMKGNGFQNIYLAPVPEALAIILGGLIGHEFPEIRRSTIADEMPEEDLQVAFSGVEVLELHQEREIARDEQITETEKSSLVLARRGQGVFKRRVFEREKCCRITKVDNPAHLIASHCKPWRHSTNPERLDGENGLMLTPTIDHLFDRGFISFDDSGEVLISPVAHRPSLQRMGIETERSMKVGIFSQGQKSFLQFHRDRVFLKIPKAG